MDEEQVERQKKKVKTKLRGGMRRYGSEPSELRLKTPPLQGRHSDKRREFTQAAAY